MSEIAVFPNARSAEFMSATPAESEREKVRFWLVPAWLEKPDVGAARVTERDCASKGRPAPHASTRTASPITVRLSAPGPGIRNGVVAHALLRAAFTIV